ncbi:MAG: ArsR/SmtB family transcription factor [Anaerovoracaceae bacterium]
MTDRTTHLHRESVRDDRREGLCCDATEVHMEEVRAAAQAVPSEAELKDVAELYKLFSDYSRVRILYLLAERELCVCDLTELMDINQSAISNHLRLLRNGKLVKSRREGKNVYYSLADRHVETILQNGLEHILEDKGEM